MVSELELYVGLQKAEGSRLPDRTSYLPSRISAHLQTNETSNKTEIYLNKRNGYLGKKLNMGKSSKTIITFKSNDKKVFFG